MKVNLGVVVALVVGVAVLVWGLTKQSSGNANALYVIEPYVQHGTWVFDDPSHRLRREPFVAGIPEILDSLTADIPDAPNGFRLTFSGQPFPGFELEAERGKPEHGGCWYHVKATGQSGWLCPAMFKYFPQAPPALYARADPLE